MPQRARPGAIATFVRQAALDGDLQAEALANRPVQLGHIGGSVLLRLDSRQRPAVAGSHQQDIGVTFLAVAKDDEVQLGTARSFDPRKSTGVHLPRPVAHLSPLLRPRKAHNKLETSAAGPLAFLTKIDHPCRSRRLDLEFRRSLVAHYLAVVIRCRLSTILTEMLANIETGRTILVHRPLDSTFESTHARWRCCGRRL
jgi:hypothetical protein